jgi:hypothetical protein
MHGSCGALVRSSQMFLTVMWMIGCAEPVTDPQTQVVSTCAGILEHGRERALAPLCVRMNFGAGPQSSLPCDRQIRFVALSEQIGEDDWKSLRGIRTVCGSVELQTGAGAPLFWVHEVRYGERTVE